VTRPPYRFITSDASSRSRLQVYRKLETYGDFPAEAINSAKVKLSETQNNAVTSEYWISLDDQNIKAPVKGTTYDKCQTGQTVRGALWDFLQIAEK
jgi:hypothetical protein